MHRIRFLKERDLSPEIPEASAPWHTGTPRIVRLIECHGDVFVIKEGNLDELL